MANPPALLEIAALTEKERDVIEILLNLPELIADLRFNGKDQLVSWGWKKRRSAVYFPLTPFSSPCPSPSPSLSRELENVTPRGSHTKVNSVKLNWLIDLIDHVVHALMFLL